MKKCLAVLSLAVLAAFPAHAEIVWALAGPYTGPVAALGLSQQAGAKQAVADINAAGGINGEKIKLKIFDDVCDPKQALTVANKIVTENIRFAIHGSCSGASLAAQRTYLDEGTLVLNTASSNPKITEDGGPRMFRTMYRDDNAAKVLANEISKNHAGKKIAVLHDKTAYGQGIAEYVRDELRKRGIQEDIFESYDPGNHDYSALVTRLRGKRVEVLFVGGYPVETAMIIRQMRESGLEAQVFGGDLSLPEFWKITGEAGEETMYAFPRDPRNEQGAKKVLKKLEKSGVVIDGYTLYAYAAAQVLAQAMTKAKSTDPAKVAAVIHKEKFKTILGPWSFDEKGDVDNIRQVMFRWHDGEYMEMK